MMLSLDEDRDAMGVRSRSSLLFHTVLLLSTSYSTPFPSQLHTTLITFLNSIFAPQILNPQPHELTTDFLRAIDLLNLYKPTQLAARRAEGKDEAEAMRASKVNGLASWMLQGILARTAERLELSSVVNKFARAHSASPTGASIPSHVLRDLRLYYWLLSNDVQCVPFPSGSSGGADELDRSGNVQSGRRCNMEGAAALATTRIFSSLQLQPYDTRLAASVEMFEVARPILRSFSYERTRRISRPDLERYNAGMSVWEDYWLPVLQRQLGVDPLAMSVLCPFAWFISLTYNATCFVSWKQNRMYGSDSGNEGGESKVRRVRTEGARGLLQWEYEGLDKCVKAAEGLIFMLSVESRVAGGWRKIQWEEAERTDGWRKLVMDETVVALSKWGMDAITCVAYIFPLVFLAKLVNEVRPFPLSSSLPSLTRSNAGTPHRRPRPPPIPHSSTTLALHAKAPPTPRARRLLPRRHLPQPLAPRARSSPSPPHPPRHGRQRPFPYPATPTARLHRPLPPATGHLLPSACDGGGDDELAGDAGGESGGIVCAAGEGDGPGVGSRVGWV